MAGAAGETAAKATTAASKPASEATASGKATAT